MEINKELNCEVFNKTKITIKERLGMKLLKKTHWFCIHCGDFHRYDYSTGTCPRKTNDEKQEQTKTMEEKNGKNDTLC